MSAVYIALICLAAMVKFWLLWIVVAGLTRANNEGRISSPVLHFGRAIVAYGLVWDVLCNVALCTVLFLDIPREPTFSQRLRRLGERLCHARRAHYSLTPRDAAAKYRTPSTTVTTTAPTTRRTR